MKHNIKSLSALLLAVLMLLPCFVACADSTDSDGTEAATGGTTDGTQAPGESESEDETVSDEDIKKEIITATKEELGKLDYGQKTLTILAGTSFEREVSAVEGTVDADGETSQQLNDAVLTRNKRMEEECNLVLENIIHEDIQMQDRINAEAMSPTGEFQVIDYRIDDSIRRALAGNLSDWVSMGIDLDKPWWDSGTADFALLGKVFFMCGDVTYTEEEMTYVLFFNKQMRAQYAETIPDPYQTVKDWEWTLDYFNSITQGISYESSGDGVWDENDTYGLVTTSLLGNTLFIGSGLCYIKNDRSMDRPELALDSTMDKALLVLDTAQNIFNQNNTTYISPEGEENRGLDCFRAGRAMFYSEVAIYLPRLNKNMDAEYGVLPIPKYDKAQEVYRTWAYGAGGCLSVTSAIPEADTEMIGKLVQYYAILSAEEVKPAYYDVMLTTQAVRDNESGEMLDLIFANRVYDMSFYFSDTFGLSTLFSDAVCRKANTFSSRYTSATKKFDSKVNQLLKDLEKKDN